ncbi:Gfo/Idh/MocA family oxidoreductase [Chitinophaga sp. YIM B06452]|uniref:Gfo/Idh/MocA family oxidoreductase n=1 Tax=Chitinophaga sp. YIM B06452 TaxID=3082158 RepID=UPI0031FF00F6
MKKVGIIGAGQLGSRHLQALAKVNAQLDIYISDISSQSLEIAKGRFEEVPEGARHQVHYLTSVEEFPAQLEIVIIATNSEIRKVVIEKLLTHSQVKHLILEKFLFTKAADYEKVQQLFDRHAAMNVWVNCPRRTFDVYKQIAAGVKGKGPVKFVVTGSAWGLGCNSIHFLDLFSFVTGETEFTVMCELIDNEYIPSKRQGYVEFTGSLCLGAAGHHMDITSFKTGSHPVVVSVHTPESSWTVKEGKGELEYAEAGNGWEVTSSKVSLPPQSVTGTAVVNDLLSRNSCDLVTFTISKQLHLTLLNVFLDKYNFINKESSDICPIT